jgi:hypothetical protein
MYTYVCVCEYVHVYLNPGSKIKDKNMKFWTLTNMEVSKILLHPMSIKIYLMKYINYYQY